MNQLPLISIGVPTYNRPEGLRNALIAIMKQSYTNIEIIVSDNCSPGDDVKNLMEKLCRQDQRISYYRQERNFGTEMNFKFVLENAKGEYFMWTADDDEWQGVDFLTNLFEYAPSNILTFPDAILCNENKSLEFPLRIYENCKSNIDYSKAFCSGGAGYPFYGLYNLPLFYQTQQKFQFDSDLPYYNEGTFIHKLFLAGPVKYVKEAGIKFSTSSIKPSYSVLVDCFLEYFRRTILIYVLSDLPFEIKTDIINVIFYNYGTHIKDLTNNYIAEQHSKKINGPARIKKAIKMLVKGRI